MQLVALDEEDRRYVDLSVAVLVVLAVTLIALGVGTLVGRAAFGNGESASGNRASAVCVDSISRADAALAEAKQVDEALKAQTTIADDLLAKRVTSEQALRRSLPGLTEGAMHSMRLDQAIREYEAVRDRCTG